MALMMLIFWGGVAWVVVTLIQHNGTWRTRDQLPPSADPLRILDERFARGEIDDDDYRRRRDVLQTNK
jgi:putative membrane protein